MVRISTQESVLRWLAIGQRRRYIRSVLNNTAVNPRAEIAVEMATEIAELARTVSKRTPKNS